MALTSSKLPLAGLGCQTDPVHSWLHCMTGSGEHKQQVTTSTGQVGIELAAGAVSPCLPSEAQSAIWVRGQ